MGVSLFPEPQQPKPGVLDPTPLVPGAAPRPVDGATTLFPSGTPEDAQRLKQAVRIGAQTPASNAGRTLALNRKMGMPLAVIQRNLPAVEEMAAQRDLDADEFRAVYPVAAQWMAEHPLHASVGVPDLKQMSAIEAAATALKMGFQSGRKQAKASTAMFDAMDSGRQLHPMERYLLEKNIKDAGAQPGRANFLEEVLFFGSQFGGQMTEALPEVGEGAGKGFMAAAIGAIGATLAGVTAPITIGGGIAVGATYGLAKSVFKQEAGSAYEGLSQIEGTAGETIDESTKRTAAYGVGALNAAIEVALDVSVLGAPFKQLAKKFAQDATNDLLVRPTMRQAMATFGKHYVGALVAEPTQEVAQEMTNIVAEEVAKMVTNGNFATLMNDPAQREEAMQRLADIAEQTAKGALLIGLPGPSLNLGSDIVRARNATKRVNAYVALGKAMESASPALVESGGAATVAERSLGQGANFYLDVQSFTEYFQSQGVDPRVAAREIWGDTKAYDEAVQGNSSLEMPVRTYAEKVAATKANEFFAKEIRRAPDEMNGRESEAFLNAAQEMLAERDREAEMQAPAQAQTERAALTESIAAQLVATQQYREQDAKDMAAQMAHFYTAMAAQLPGTTPQQLAEKYPLTITRGERPVEKEVKARRERAKAAGAAAEAHAKVLGDVTTQLEAQAVSPDAAVAETAKGRLAFLNTITPSFSDEAEAARLTEEEGEARVANRARPRTPSGTLKNLTKATDEELANEYQMLTDANAVENTATTSLQTDYGDTWTGMKGGAMKAMGRIAARNKTITKLEAEFARRGTDPAEAYMAGYSALINSSPEGFSFEQAPRVESEAFKRWFGDSKVVDENGNPLVLYHQTSKTAEEAIRVEGFDVSKARARLSDEGVPDGIFLKPHDRNIGVGAPDVKDQAQIPLYAKIERPLIVDDRDALARWLGKDKEYADLAYDTQRFDREQARVFDSWDKEQKPERSRAFQEKDDTAWRAYMNEADARLESWKAGNEERATKARARATVLLREAGHDGVILEKDQGGLNRVVKTYVVFEPTQVKSATENRGTFDATRPSILEQPAYHGSPHIFDEFSLQKIGSGEGAQAYGWGIYFAGRKEVAEYYKRTLTRPTWSYDGETVERGKENWRIAAALEDLRPQSGSLKDIAAAVGAEISRLRDHAEFAEKLYGKDTADMYRRKADVLESLHTDKLKLQQGRLYKVEIPENDTMLDWDKPLDDQPKKVLDALTPEAMGLTMREVDGTFGYVNERNRPIGAMIKNTTAEKFRAQWMAEVRKAPDGQTLYRFLGLTPEETSRALAHAGVTGIRYLDEGSRNRTTWTAKHPQGGLNEFPTEKAARAFVEKNPEYTLVAPDQTHNYVIFDDKLIKIAEFEQAQQGGAEGPRGRITFAGRNFNIEILPKADLSTFLHESGHFYLEVLGDLAKDSPAVAADYAKILKYLGAEAGTPLTVEQHETFARSIEAYFLEGKAPSMELRRVFHRFRTWLMALYRTIVGLDVKLTNEVRGVFDRMFATDQEIQAAEREAELVPIFTTAEEAGMSADEFANYQQAVEDAHITATDKVRTKLLRQFMRERDEWWKEARADVRQQVADEVNARPVYIALDVLRKGLYPDGTVVENQPRLNRSEVVALKGEDFLKRLGQRITQKEDGLSLEQASEQFGFTSGDEMLQAFVDAPARKQVIESETDVRMKAKYGDMVTDGTLADEAEAAIQNEHQADIVHAEMRALRRLANKVKPFVRQAEKEGEAALAAEQKERDYERRWLEAEHKLATAIAVGKKQAEIETLREAAKAAKAETAAGRRAFNAGIPDIAFVRQVAQERIARMKVSSIRPMVFWVAARKAARAAIAAAGKQDFVTALNEKQHELLNQELYRAATQALEQAEADKDYANRLQTTGKQQRLGKAGGGYLEQINAILERFDFRIRTNVAAERRLSLLRFIEEQKALDIPIDIPVDIQDAAYQKPWREMTVEELRGVVDTLRHLDHLATFKNKLLRDAAKRTLEEAQAQAAGSITQNARKTLPAKAESNLPQDAAGKKIQAFVAAHRKLASYLRQMDGFEDGGVLQQMIMRQLNEADGALAEFNADATKRLSDIFAKHYTKAELVKLYKKTYQKGLKDSLSKMGVLMMALNWGTEDNQQKLVAGLGLTYKRQISETDVGAVLNQLDKRDWQFVQDVWEMIGSYWPQIESLAKRLDGIAPQKIDGVPIQTKFGLVQGAYFPISYDKTQSTIRHHDAVAVSADEVRRGMTAKRSTKAGARNERVSGVKSPLRLDFGVIREHLADLAQDLTHTETLIDVGRILTGDEVKSAIREHYGDVVYKQIMSSIDAIAAGDVPAQDGWDAAANFIRTGATVAGLGWNLTTSFLQPLGLSNAIARVGAKWVGLGLKEWLGDAVHMQNTTKWIVEKSQMMKYRTTTQMRETAELMHSIGMDRSFTESLIDLGMDKATAGTLDLADLKQSYFWFITRMQLVADIPTWLGAYRKALASMPLNEVDDAKAVSIADQAVLDAQSGGAIKDLASVQRGGAFRKIFTAFYSYMNLVLNQNAEAFARLDIKRPASVGRFVSDMLLINIIPVTVGFFLKRAVRGQEPDDEDIPEKLLREYASYVTGMFVGLRELSGVIQGFAGYEGPAGARFYAEVSKLMKQAGQGEADAAFLKALNGAAGVIFHYPAGQVQRTVQGFNALMQDRTNNPLALLFGPPQR